MTNELIKFENDLEKLVKQNKVMVALNQDPPAEWVKIHPSIKNFKYVPIERVEWLLKTLFNGNYKIEIIKTGLVLNTIEVTVRVHYKSVVTGEWLFHDGIGGKEIQTSSGSGSLKLDLSNINRGAIEMALPIAKSEALKNACKSFGKMFGSDLNRKNEMEYSIDLTLIKMDRNHPNWSKVVSAIKNKTHTLDKIKSKYSLTEDAELILKSFENDRNI